MSRHERDRSARERSTRGRRPLAVARARAQHYRDQPQRPHRATSPPSPRRVRGRALRAETRGPVDGRRSRRRHRRRAQPHHRRGAWDHPPARRRRHPRHGPRRRRPQTPTRHPHPPQPHPHPTDTTTHLGIPITTPIRTIIDLASTLPPLPLEQALDQADRRGLIDFAELKARPIPRSLQAILARYTGPTFTRSELEDRFHALCDNHDLPRPLSNTIIEGEEVDFAWRKPRLSSRSTATATTAPRRASRTTANATSCSPSPAGHVMRFTWTQVTTRPELGRPRGRQAAGRVWLTSPARGRHRAGSGGRAGRHFWTWPCPPQQSPLRRRRARDCAGSGPTRCTCCCGFVHGDRRADGQRHRHHAVAHARAADRRLPGRAAHVRVRAAGSRGSSATVPRSCSAPRSPPTTGRRPQTAVSRRG